MEKVIFIHEVMCFRYSEYFSGKCGSQHSDFDTSGEIFEGLSPDNSVFRSLSELILQRPIHVASLAGFAFINKVAISKVSIKRIIFAVNSLERIGITDASSVMFAETLPKMKQLYSLNISSNNLSQTFFATLINILQ